MNKLKACSLSILASTFILSQPSTASVLTPPPLETQVKEVSGWFTGLFNNFQQVTNNPNIPLITMSNCKVRLSDALPNQDTETIFLEQKSSAFQRTSFYSFNKGNSAVNLDVRPFINPSIVNGLCDKPELERVVTSNNISTAACNLLLLWEPQRYVGNNAPNGCPTSTGGKVVSKVTIFDNGVNSLDQIFNAQGNLLVATPIEYRKVSIPESSIPWGILTIGIGLTVRKIKDKRKKKLFKRKLIKRPINIDRRNLKNIRIQTKFMT
ncbi:hypothetical protein RIVM261_087300 [Rivularia sp. IAM M-261]|nr:hypothetical protein RIVM261_087300 [Rivularia sp. IAM M-261]